MTFNDLARSFITDNPQFKENQGIARELRNKYRTQYPERTLEQWRGTVRSIKGVAGNQKRDKFKNPDKLKFFQSGFDKWANENLNIELAPWDEPFVIPSSIKQLNIIADLHSVHMDPKVMTAFLKRTKDREAVLLNGDLMDSESLSRHLKGHNVIEYEKEIELCHQILRGLKQEFNHVYFKAGNHDFWLERYLLMNAREVFRVLGLDLASLLRCGELGVHYIHNLKYIQYGDLDIVHGHEFPGFGNGKFPAVGLLDKWQSFKHAYDVKVLCAHSHRTDQTISRKSKTGEYGQAWAMPAFCRKSAGYAPFAGWDNGWAVAKGDARGTNVELIVL